MFTNTPLPWHARQAAAQLNGGVYAFITTKINVTSINTQVLYKYVAMAPYALHQVTPAAAP